MNARPLTPLVDEATEWGAVEWWRLELRSFDRAPRAQRTLALLGPKGAWTKEYGRPSVGGCLTTLVFLACLVAPVVAAAVMYQWWVEDDDSRVIPLVLAGQLMIASLIVTVHGVVVDIRRPRARLMSAVIKVGLVFLACDAVVVLIVVGAVNGGRFDAARDPSLWWLLPFVVDAAIHVWSIARGATSEGGPQNPIENLVWTLREIEPEIQQRILRARNDAIIRLHGQEKVDDTTAQRALACDIGHLALTMAPEARSSYYPASSPTQPSSTDST